ncbi:3-oxosteroid 1-dehydrogenase [Microbacterium terrae]|uniref:3-oxosteroid 1-dehydrogenase n=1 Tax=Microbacterium terrae TaxID=69369 RepID=A0A0M2HBW9_9MICO|nr:FAD-binding protein [Microbacterium terrae]KJL44007.1 3-oxosteroid 1-dehydrogenase [Microbacterium terrae]MBP1079459.1 3-oxosteroid 1-dehydrogenase [Microbacterium terrae]GLJ98860.1 3-oxosteroid 1-dehydrogenase [Microbacterium terrae]
MHWDFEFDVVSVGSGGGGLVAAASASDAGGTALVVEKRGVLGGSTGMSGGVVWLPNNPVMKRDGIDDSEERGMRYFASTVGDVGPASSDARRRTFLSSGADMIRLLEDKGVAFVRCDGYSDYYSNNDGGHDIGRSIEPRPFDGRRIGEWLPKIQPGMAAGLGMSVKTNELRHVQYFNRSLRSFVIAARVQLRTWVSALTKRPILTNGTALIAELVRVCLDAGVELWTDTAFEEFIVEDGAVTGIRVRRGEDVVAVRARKGVVLASGGFAHNPALRREHGGDQTPDPAWSVANPGDTGEALSAAIALGAQTDLLDEAWWLPGPDRALGASTLSAARNRPGTIIVGTDGRRFVNESNSYVEVGKAMFARDQVTPAVPSWLVFDDGYRRRYAHRRSLLVGRLSPEWLESGLIVQAATLRELAVSCGIDPQGLEQQVAEFNRHAAAGEDPQFGRGTSAYNVCLGDPGGSVPNAAVGPLESGPFYAFRVFPSDVGTCGGLITDEAARVLTADGPIPGLYATGNTTATVMGRHYLGAGASIANSMVFGYVAARHALGGSDDPEQPQDRKTQGVSA